MREPTERSEQVARWTVVHGEQVFVIETTPADKIILDMPAGRPFITDNREIIADLRRKLGMAIGDAQGADGESR